MSTQKLANEIGRRSELARFGYRSDKKNDAIDAAEWMILRADFQTIERPVVPAWSALPENLLSMARVYIGQRRKLDQLMDQCDAAHAKIISHGANAALVEAYATERDKYEDAVEAFGEMRSRLEIALQK